MVRTIHPAHTEHLLPGYAVFALDGTQKGVCAGHGVAHGKHPCAVLERLDEPIAYGLQDLKSFKKLEAYRFCSSSAELWAFGAARAQERVRTSDRVLHADSGFAQQAFACRFTQRGGKEGGIASARRVSVQEVRKYLAHVGIAGVHLIHNQQGAIEANGA